MIEQSELGWRLTGAMRIANATTLLQTGRDFLRAAIAAKAASGSQEIVIDLIAVQETDSSALGVLFAGLRTAQQSGLRLKIANIPPTMLSQAELYGVLDALPLVPLRA